ncbi:hypothetical protein Lfu02_29020 [Longispora fulva]|nr:hypothetical protein Lfu02_29020 [Longispora fulva]
MRSGVAAVGGLFAGALVAGPAWADGLEESRRGMGAIRGVGLVCCLVVVGLVVLGALIGISVTRKRRK